MDEVEKFFLPISKSLGTYGVRDGWVIPQNVQKKSKSLHPNAQPFNWIRIFTKEDNNKK